MGARIAVGLVVLAGLYAVLDALGAGQTAVVLTVFGAFYMVFATAIMRG